MFPAVVVLDSGLADKPAPWKDGAAEFLHSSKTGVEGNALSTTSWMPAFTGVTSEGESHRLGQRGTWARLQQ
jgi:hypothetical protein